MMEIERTNQFKKDFKRAIKRGKNLDRLQSIVQLLAREEPLPARYKNHKLSGDMEGLWECHVEPDYLLIYQLPPGKLILIRLGTHADLF